MKSTEQVLSELSNRLNKTVTITNTFVKKENGHDVPYRQLVIDGEVVKDEKIIQLAYAIANESRELI